MILYIYYEIFPFNYKCINYKKYKNKCIFTSSMVIYNCLDSRPLHFSIRARVLWIIEHIILYFSMQKTALLSTIHRCCVILIHYNILLLLNILLYVYIVLFLYYYMIFEKMCFYFYYYTFFIFIFFDGYFYENNVLLYPWVYIVHYTRYITQSQNCSSTKLIWIVHQINFKCLNRIIPEFLNRIIFKIGFLSFYKEFF